jgi:hypothetical protein
MYRVGHSVSTKGGTPTVAGSGDEAPQRLDDKDRAGV